MKCSFCSKIFYIFKEYMIHLKYAHHQDNYYVCPVDNCKRTYNTKCSFKYHLTTIHNFFQKLDKKTAKNVNENIENCNVTLDVPCSSVDINISQTQPTSFITSPSRSSTFETALSLSIQRYLAELYGNLNLPRATIQKLIQSINSLLTDISPILKESITNLNSTENTSTKHIDVLLNILQNSFTELDTDHKRKKYLIRSGKYVEPSEVIVGVSRQRKKFGRNNVLAIANCNVYIISLAQTLQKFLELPNVFKTILNYQKKLKSYDESVLGNIVHGTLWQEILKSNDGEVCIPIILYSDDFESGNPLGSRAGQYKICGVYASIATIPPQLCSKLENVFLVMTFYAHYRTQFGNSAIFKKLIDELKMLQQVGIVIKDDKEEDVVVKFYIAAIAGDNLGLHGILGFQESFSANYYCRFCVMHKNDCSKETTENKNKIRKQEDYLQHIAENVGVKENSVWNSLDFFHVYHNWTCDVMHDLCEGIHRYGMALIVKHFVDGGTINLSHLNSRIKYYNYQSGEKNHPPEIKYQCLRNGVIIFSASEMLCFVRNFRFIIGDLIESKDDVWGYYLLLLELTEILTSQVFTMELLEYLQILIQEHHETYMRIFRTNLKPKHHFLTHYVSIIKKIGPPIFVSAFKFESKHKELKRICNSITCRKNLPLSIARRYQLKCCQRFILHKGFKDSVKFGKKWMHSKHESSCGLDQSYFAVPWYKVNGVCYEPQNVMLYNYIQDVPEFMVIDNIFIKLCDDNIVLFFGKKLTITSYHDHYKAYSVRISKIAVNRSLSDCISKMPSIVHKVGDLLLVIETN